MKKKSINDFEKNSFELINKAVFGKTMENVIKHAVLNLLQ